MNQDDLKRRTKEFAHRCARLALALPETFLGQHICRQLIRCGTSVACNYRAACLGQSKAAFVSKLSIVIEEADESAFWMEFVIDEELLKKEKVASLLQEPGDLTAIFVATRKTASFRE